MTTKHDIEIEKIKASVEKWGMVCNLIKHLLSVGGVVGALYVVFAGLEPFLSPNPDVIKAIALIFDKINFGNITGYLLAGATGTGWLIERRGKKRAIKEKGRYQKLLERNDEYRSSSGLTETGDTPKEDL